ncbi:hypothetical protein GCM10009113_16720 [Marinobacter szutsaonensis]
MCGAMDGGAQAHMDVLEAVSGKPLPIGPAPKLIPCSKAPESLPRQLQNNQEC